MNRISTFLIVALLLIGASNLCAQNLSEDAVQFTTAEGYKNDTLKNQTPLVGKWTGSNFMVNTNDPGTLLISDDAVWQVATYERPFAETNTFTLAMKFSYNRADEALNADQDFIGLILKSGSDKIEIKIQRMKWDNKRYRLRSFTSGAGYFSNNTASTEDLFGFGDGDAASDNLWFEVVITKGDNASAWSAVAKIVNLSTETEIMNWDLGAFAVAEAFHGSNEYYGAITTLGGGPDGKVSARMIEAFDATPLKAVATSIDSKNLKTPSIYPNPVNDVLYVKSSDYKRIEIFNISGKLVKQADLQDSSVDVSYLKSGIYLVKLHGNDTNVSKIIKR